MKSENRLSKKVISLLLSAVLVATMLPTFAFTASAADPERFLMTYFTGNLQTEQQIRMAVSTDGINFKPLNGGNAILQEKSTDTHSYTDPTNETYTYTDGVRDPYIFDGHDGYYYVIATDLEATQYGFWGNQPQMVLWRSADLVNWSDAYYINVAQIINEKKGTSYSNHQFQRTWAPEVYYENGQYMVYFAFAGDGYTATRMYYMTTDNLMDWTHYSEPQLLYDPGADAIDGDIIKQGSTYYMFYKDETEGRKTVCLATATNLTGPYTYVGQFESSSTTGAIEGCQVYTVDGDYYLVADRYGDAGKFVIYNMGDDLATVAAKGSSIPVNDGDPITTVNETTGFSNLTARHGSFLKISDAQYKAITSAYGGVTSDDVMYNFTTSYNNASDGWQYATYNDSSLRDIDIMFKESGSSATVAHDSGYATLKNATFFVNDEDVRSMFPDDVYTVSFDYSLESTTNLSAPIFALGTGTGAPSENTDYVMIFGNGDMWVRKSGESTDTYVATTGNLTLGVTYHYDIVSDGTNITFYRDGDEVGKIAATVDFPDYGTRYAAFGFTDGHSSAGYGYGSYSHIRFRDKAISQSVISSEFDKKLVYTKAGGSDTVDGKKGVLNVSNSGDHSVIEPVVSHNASSYTIAGWVNPGDVANNNAIIAIGNDKWTPAPSGRYFALMENGTIRFNYCSGLNSGGNYSEHFVDIYNAFNNSLATSKWSYIQLNIVPISNNQVKLSVWVNGRRTYQNDISLITNVDGSQVDGNDYAYGMLGFMQLPTNKVFLGNMRIPSWWQVADDTSYVKDVRIYSQAMDPQVLYGSQSAEDYVEENIDSIETVPSFNAEANYQGSKATNGYANVVYDDNNTTWSNETAVSGFKNSAISLPSNIVLAYDGTSNTPALPTGYSFRVESNNYRRLIYIVEDSNMFELKSYWRGYNTGSNSARPTTYVYNDDTNDGTGYETNASEYHYTNTPDDKGLSEISHDNVNTYRGYYNRLYYSGTGNTDTYLDTATSVPFTIRAAYRSNYGSRNNDTITVNSNIYVLNYKPIREIRNGTTKVPGTDSTALEYYNNVVKGNEWMYTEDSLDQYYNAMYYVMKADPNNYDYQDSASTAASECAADIKKGVDEFAKINLVKKTFKIDYNRAEGFSTETVTAGNTLASAPSQSATVYNGDGTHTVYNWENDNAPSNTHMPTSDEVYNEESTTSNCDHNVAQAHTAASGDTNGYTDYACSVCGNIDEANRLWDDQTAAWDALRDKAADVAVNYANTDYTTSSREAYKSDCDAVNIPATNDSSKSEEYINGLADALTTAEGKLNHVADFSELDATMAAKAETKATNNSDGTSNIYTYDSWVPFAEAYTNGDTYYSMTAAQRADTPMYATDESGIVQRTLSADQTNINENNTAINSTYDNLKTVDGGEKYETYEAAKSVINSSLDSRKYTTDGLVYINGAIATADGVLYKTLTAQEAERYNACTGTSLPEGAMLRNASGDAADIQTAAILTASTNLNDPANKENYIKKYHLDFSVQNDEGDTVYTDNTMQYYGDSVDLTVPEAYILGNKVALWSTTNMNDTNTDAESSQKASGTVGATYTKIVSGNMAVVAELEQTNKDPGAGINRYDICDVYGNLIDIIYSADVKSDGITTQTVTFTEGDSATAKNIPMYGFEKWSLTELKVNHYELTPVYGAKPTYNYTFTGASSVNDNTGSTTVLNNVEYDTLVKVTSDDADFAAWAVRTAAGKLQIASYDRDCTFFACASEDYVAILSDGNGGYVTADSVAVTAANIDGVLADLGTDKAEVMNALVNDKIENKKPFISVQNTKMTASQARVYARITQGATGNKGFGVLVRKGNYTDPADMSYGVSGVVKMNVTSVLPTGQFTCTVSPKAGGDFDVDNVSFRCFIEYPAKYSTGNNTYDINGTDYSVIAVADKNA